MLHGLKYGGSALRSILAVLAAIVLGVGAVHAQALPDDKADVAVSSASFTRGAGPVVAIDSAHHNYHTVDGRYAPLAALLRNDGFRVVDSRMTFTRNNLATAKVLVIANAFPVDDGVPPPVPTPAAFSPSEVSAAKAFVENGGSLLLITDHMPYAGAISDLALAFGFRLKDGAVQQLQPVGPPPTRKPDIFRIADRTWQTMLSPVAVTKASALPP